MFCTFPDEYNIDFQHKLWNNSYSQLILQYFILKSFPLCCNARSCLWCLKFSKKMNVFSYCHFESLISEPVLFLNWSQASFINLNWAITFQKSPPAVLWPVTKVKCQSRTGCCNLKKRTTHESKCLKRPRRSKRDRTNVRAAQSSLGPVGSL